MVSLLALAAVVFMGKANETLLRGIDSNIHAAVAMGATSHGLMPKLPMPFRPYTQSGPSAPVLKVPGSTFNDHPFFLFWLNGLAMRVLGPQAWSARLLTGLFSVGSVFLTLSLGRILVSPVFGFVSAIFLVFCRDFVLTSATMSLDTAMVFFILLSFYFAVQRRFLLVGAVAGVGLWMKTPVVLLVFPTFFLKELVQACSHRDWTKWMISMRRWGWSLLIALCVGSWIWIVTGVFGGWDLVQDYWVRQLWGTAVGGRGQGGGTQWGFFFHFVRTGFIPGLPFLLWALVKIVRQRRFLEEPFLISVLAVLVMASVVTALRYQLGHYITPVFPFLALISAYAVHEIAARNEAKVYLATCTFAPLLMAALLIFPISMGPEAFVALKKFMPLIQAHGDCDDVIGVVPGGEPIGSALDYELVLNFYTSHPVEVMECKQLRQKLEAKRPPVWLIVAEENLEPCLPPQDREVYRSILRVGHQYLFTIQDLNRGVFDLTPLELELRPTQDCRSPAYPKDLWHRSTSAN